MSKTLIIKEGMSRLLLPVFPDIQIENLNRWAQEELFDVMYKYKVIGRARLIYRTPFVALNLKESHTFLVYNRPVNYVKKKLKDELGDDFTGSTQLVWMLMKWEERDLVAFEEIFREQWEKVNQEHPDQHQFQLNFQ